MTAEYSQEQLRRVQLAELEILEAVAELCAREGIVYFLDSGTLLGAVRHGGFIPWDDDIDIGMPRADYDRFLSCARDGLAEGFSLHTADNTPGYAGMFAKVYKDGTVFETLETREAGCPQAIFVDVFPYDVLAADPSERSRQLKRAALWQRMSYLYYSGSITVPLEGALGAFARGACRVLHVAVRALFTPEGIRRRFDAARAFAGEASDDLAMLPYPEFGPFPRSVLLPPAPCEFEGRGFCGPRDPERYLELGYGSDWSVLPPEKDRRTHCPISLDFGEGSQSEVNLK